MLEIKYCLTRSKIRLKTLLCSGDEKRRVDWRHREHSSSSRNEVRAYGLFLGQKERTLIVIVIVSLQNSFISLSLSLFLPNLSPGVDRRSRVCIFLSLLSLSLSTVLTGSAGFSLSLSLSPTHAAADDSMYFAAAARWRPYVAWVKSALWCCHAEVTFPRSKKRVDWQHQEHSSLSRNKVRAYSIFLGQKESPSFTTL
jgi:hypothetical protein